MLETKPLPTDRTVRMAARSASRVASSAALPATALPRTGERSSPVATSRVLRTQNTRLSRSEARLLTMAISCTVVVCGLLVLYLAAYAHVTLLGIDQAKSRTELKQKRLENETLKAQLAERLNPDRVAVAATALGMTRDHKRVDYIAPPRTEDGVQAVPNPAVSDAISGNSAMKTGSKAGSQVAILGQTADDNQPTRND